MKNVFIVNTCDVWKSYASYNLVGVFTSRLQVNKVISRLIQQHEIELSEKRDNTPKSWNNLTISELNDSLLYVDINEITLNEDQ